MEIEARLAEVLSDFARTLGTDFPIQAILDHLVIKIVEVLPITATGVTLISPGADPRYVAASDDSALRFEKLQTELGQGQCVEAYQSGQAVSIPDLSLEDRFPEFITGALDEGLRAIFTFPLRQGSTQLGALDLYRTSVGPLDARELSAAQTLADVAAAYLLNAQARADLEASSEQAVKASLHDDLTGLPNRALLVQRLEHAILRCRRSGRTVAILYADLDDFKAINDTYGHHVGDELLIAVAKRLTNVLRPGDTLARLAGDEFAILCAGRRDVCWCWSASRAGVRRVAHERCPACKPARGPAGRKRRSAREVARRLARLGVVHSPARLPVVTGSGIPTPEPRRTVGCVPRLVALRPHDPARRASPGRWRIGLRISSLQIPPPGNSEGPPPAHARRSRAL